MSQDNGIHNKVRAIEYKPSNNGYKMKKKTKNKNQKI